MFPEFIKSLCMSFYISGATGNFNNFSLVSVSPTLMHKSEFLGRHSKKMWHQKPWTFYFTVKSLKSFHLESDIWAQALIVDMRNLKKPWTKNQVFLFVALVQLCSKTVNTPKTLASLNFCLFVTWHNILMRSRNLKNFLALASLCILPHTKHENEKKSRKEECN